MRQREARGLIQLDSRHAACDQAGRRRLIGTHIVFPYRHISESGVHEHIGNACIPREETLSRKRRYRASKLERLQT